MIYPIDQQIAEFLESAYDPETGELFEWISEEELNAQIEAMQMDFDEKIKSLRNAYMSTCVDAECMEAEASALYQIQQQTSKAAKAARNRAERIKRFIAWLLQGEKWAKDGCKVSYTTRQITVIDDGFVDWAKENAPEFLKEPEIRKKDVATALAAGENIKFARQEPKTYINIK